jgi:4-hydroxybenzoate polyprenyltransferase
MARLMPYMQLMRIPNVFTAMADIFMGYLIVRQSFFPLRDFFFLLTASCCLYTGGMVLNDIFDYDQDLRERPQRPLPSGRIRIISAWKLCLALGLMGICCAALAGKQSFLIAVLLLITIILYDVLLKHYWTGPIAMGCCRMLNVLLGMSPMLQSMLSLEGNIFWQILPACVMGSYIIGVTWLARNEAFTNTNLQLFPSIVLINLMFSAMALILFQASFQDSLVPWFLLALSVGLINRSLIKALFTPEPVPIQKAVKTCLLCYIPLTGALASGLFPSWESFSILLLLAPATWLGKWIYST